MADGENGIDFELGLVTRDGDGGETSLGSNLRVSKSALRVEAHGTVDEANAAIGVLRARVGDRADVAAMLGRIQGDLFNVGSDLHRPDAAGASPRVTAEPTERLEREMAAMARDLPPLTHFILPAGTLAAAHCHSARTVVRRAERRVVALASEQPVTPEVLRYLNRLSDHLFLLGRVLNDNGAGDVAWVPERGQ